MPYYKYGRLIRVLVVTSLCIVSWAGIAAIAWYI